MLSFHRFRLDFRSVAKYHSEVLFFFRFYRYVLNPELSFDEDGKLSTSAPAIFHNMPQSALLTLIMDTPQSWMVEAVDSPYDLDNIHLAEVRVVRETIECWSLEHCAMLP